MTKEARNPKSVRTPCGVSPHFFRPDTLEKSAGLTPTQTPLEYDEPIERVGYDFGLKRRAFVQILGAGLLIAAGAPALAQRRGGRQGRGGARNIAARIHLGADGIITVMTGKV